MLQDRSLSDHPVGMSVVGANGKPIESVWDFPRPPAIERVDWRIRVAHGGETVADAPWAYRILETSQPPAYYVDPSFVVADRLQASSHMTFCEWKGTATYADVITSTGDVVTNAAWRYDPITPTYVDALGFWAFYAQTLDECWVDDEQVGSNPGNFYGGWVTNNVEGPFKGAPGTMHW